MTPRARWGIHLGVLVAYPVLVAAASWLRSSEDRESVLPTGAGSLLAAVGLQLTLFAAFFGAAWRASRVSAEELGLRWPGGVAPVVLGLLYSALLRIAAFVAALVLVVAFLMATGMDAEELLEHVREAGITPAVGAQTLVDDPIYFALSLTLVSFVLAGFTEEVWRAGVLVGLRHVGPRTFATPLGGVAAAAVAAVPFGIGHLPQGALLVVVLTFVGFGLGLIQVFHRSVWHAVFAHGFFDATTFVLIRALAGSGLLPG